MFFYNRTVHEQRNASSVQFYSTVSNTVSNMILYETDRFFNTAIVEPGLQVIMNSDDITSLNEFSKQSLSDFMETLISYNLMSKYIDSIQVHFTNPDYVITTKGNNYSQYFKTEPWYNAEATSFKKFIPGTNNKEFYILYNLYNKNRVCGKFVFTVTPQFIYTTSFNENITTYDVVITDLDDNILFSTNTDIKISDFNKKAGKEIEIRSSGNYDYISKQIDDLKVHARITYDNSYRWEFFMLCIFAIIFSILLSAFIAFCVALISYKTISGIMHEFNETIEYTDDSDTANHEINYIIDNITEIKNKNLTLEQELITNFTNLNNLQLEMLQMQITPHFLFNVLNNINFLVMSQNGLENPTSNLIYRISDMLTSLLDTSKFIIDLKGELEICKNYIEIQKVAYNNNFDVFWKTEEHLMNCNVPKFILQPILENAFKHGVKSMNEDTRAYIDISVYEKNGCIVFKTVNNTNNIDEELLSEIQKKLNEEIRPNKTQIGLLNLNKRIKLIYGGKYGCNIYSESGNIVTVAKIPLDK